MPDKDSKAGKELNMKEYQRLTADEQKEALDKAYAWRQEHLNHVDKLVLVSDGLMAPSNSDMFHPELWKSMHWTWFMGLLGYEKSNS